MTKYCSLLKSLHKVYGGGLCPTR